MEIGLGSLVVDASGMVMVIAAAAGEEMFCVSPDKSIKQWRHRSALRQAAHQAAMTAGDALTTAFASSWNP